MARREAGGHYGSKRNDQKRRVRRVTRYARVREQAEVEFPCAAGFGPS